MTSVLQLNIGPVIVAFVLCISRVFHQTHVIWCSHVDSIAYFVLCHSVQIWCFNCIYIHLSVALDFRHVTKI
jgi:hypothetical protein